MLFPFPSLNVQLTVNVPCVEYVNGFVVVPVIVPAQLSVVVGAVTVAEHCPVTVAKVGVDGFVTSSTITVCVAVTVLPLPSLNDHVTTVVHCVVIGKTVVVIPVVVPAQALFVTGAISDTEH